MIRRLASSSGRFFGLVFLAAMLLVALRAQGVLKSGWTFWLTMACLGFATLVLVAEDARSIWRRWRRPESD